jgi:signal transduction histidine kinase
MTVLIEGLVELARADAETPIRERVRLDFLVDEAVATAARRSPTPIRAHLTPTVVEAAPAAISRAVGNLIDNAIKWSPDGAPVEVTVRDGTVTVRDHGPGIDAADQPRIFDRFYRAPAARTLPGSGLGLAIARQVAEAHGGTITAEPAPGGGSLFTLRLPMVGGPDEGRTPTAPDSPGDAATESNGKRRRTDLLRLGKHPAAS